MVLCGAAVIWSPKQDTALLRVDEWFKSGSSPFFYLAGYFGTGKTRLARHFAESARNPKFAAFTGKAASVMRKAGCTDASTIHQLIYAPADKSRAHLRELELHLSKLLVASPPNEQEIVQTRENIAIEKANVARPGFKLNLESELVDSDLLVVDEVSMVDRPMGLDILSFGVPVLVLGDPAQLPPIYGAGYFTSQEPNYMLTEIHRQALDNPIIRMAMDVREGKELAYGNYGESSVVRSVSPEEVLESDQVLVGKNATRFASNKRVRELKGYAADSLFPLKDERVVCLRNNHDLGLLNGATYTLEKDARDIDKYVNLTLKPEDDGGSVFVSAHRLHFLGRGKEIDPFDKRDAEEFDYAYAMTVHKFQGSQADNIVFFDEWFQAHRKEHVYTGLTRAAKKIKVVRR